MTTRTATLLTAILLSVLAPVIPPWSSVLIVPSVFLLLTAGMMFLTGTGRDRITGRTDAKSARPTE
jgi:hypothetical protein